MHFILFLNKYQRNIWLFGCGR